MRMRHFSPPTADNMSMYHSHPVYVDIHSERIRAHQKHDRNGESMERRDWNDPSWVDVTVEEVGEVSRVRNELRDGNITLIEAKRELRSELIQTLAIYAAWVDAIDMDSLGTQS